MTNTRIIHILRHTARVFLILIALFFFVFALLSGAEEYGSGMWGIVQNSPNALPWLLLLILAGATWKWEKASGIIIILFGLFTLIAFDAFEEPFVLFVISLPLIILGGVLVGVSMYTGQSGREN
jgi:hypothetical protein